MDNRTYIIFTSTRRQLGTQTAATDSAAVDLFKAWNPDYRWHELHAEVAQEGDYPVPGDPADDTLCDSCQ